MPTDENIVPGCYISYVPLGGTVGVHFSMGYVHSVVKKDDEVIGYIISSPKDSSIIYWQFIPNHPNFNPHFERMDGQPHPRDSRILERQEDDFL